MSPIETDLFIEVTWSCSSRLFSYYLNLMSFFVPMKKWRSINFLPHFFAEKCFIRKIAKAGIRFRLKNECLASPRSLISCLYLVEWGMTDYSLVCASLKLLNQWYAQKHPIVTQCIFSPTFRWSKSRFPVENASQQDIAKFPFRQNCWKFLSFFL